MRCLLGTTAFDETLQKYDMDIKMKTSLFISIFLKWLERKLIVPNSLTTLIKVQLLHDLSVFWKQAKINN